MDNLISRLNNVSNNTIPAGKRISTRIESVDDPQVNKALFSLYEALINPFKEIEELQAKVADNNDTIERNNAFSKDTVRRTIKYLLICTGIGIVVWFIIAILFSDSYFIDTISVGFIDFITSLGPKSVLWELFCFILVPGLLVGGIPSVIVNIALTTLAKAQNIQMESEITQLEKSINFKCDELSNLACFAPPDYRHSKAMNFFVNSYANSKIDNLKEAVLLFDEQDFRDTVVSSLQKIEYQNLMIMNQLDNINSSIWSANLFF